MSPSDSTILEESVSVSDNSTTAILESSSDLGSTLVSMFESLVADPILKLQE